MKYAIPRGWMIGGGLSRSGDGVPPGVWKELTNPSHMGLAASMFGGRVILGWAVGREVISRIVVDAGEERVGDDSSRTHLQISTSLTKGSK